MLRGLTDKTIVAQLNAPQVFAGDFLTSAIDASKYASLAFIVNIGDITFTSGQTIQLKMQETDGVLPFNDCALEDYGSIGIQTISGPSDIKKAYVVEYKGYKRYVRLFGDVTGVLNFSADVLAISVDKLAQP